ncbi:unnamed protein product [Amaranthus hypochondriacus]
MRSANLSFYTLIIFHFIFIITCILLNSEFHAAESHSHKVKYLPGFDGPLPFSLETGYIGVERGEVQLFYYFFESENNPKEDPLLVWLPGGPLCSGMSAILYEIGPIQFEDTNNFEILPKVILRQYSWTKNASILFMDSPVGTGFSYGTTTQAKYTGDFKTSRNLNEFLRKWLLNHPQFLSNSLYLGGDSYSGFPLPLYFVDMISGNENGLQPYLNLKGYILGNPATDKLIDGNYQVAFAHGMGLISDEFYESIQRTCGGKYQMVDESNKECKKQIKIFEWGIIGINTAMVIENFCIVEFLRLPKISHTNRRLVVDNDKNMLHPKQLGAFNCRFERYLLSPRWMNDESVREALHVRKEPSVEWKRCHHNMSKYSYEILSSVPYHVKLSAKGFRSLIYSGDHDIIVPFMGTQAWIRSLNYSIVDDWRRWVVGNQVAGFTRTYANRMTFATVKGGGHTAPEYKPKECASMFRRWIQGEPL